MPARVLRHYRWLGIAGVLGIGACTAEVPAPPNYTVAVGQTLTIELVTIGPGPVYDPAPSISSPIVRLVSVTVPPLGQRPGGPTQFFQFAGQAPGRTTITFRRSGTSVVVSDIVEVQ
jgi:hypothetical protein